VKRRQFDDHSEDQVRGPESSGHLGGLQAHVGTRTSRLAKHDGLVARKAMPIDYGGTKRCLIAGRFGMRVDLYQAS
jgi:hypothetical protein